MPSFPSAPKNGRKRKREEPQNQVDVDRNPSILELESQIRASRRHYNKLVTLMDLCWSQESHVDDEESTLAVVAVCRTFCRLMTSGNLSKNHSTSQNEAVVVQWLNDRYSDYKEILLDALSRNDTSNQSTALTLLMRLFKEEATFLRNPNETLWRTGTFAKVLKALIDAGPSTPIQDEFMQKYFQQYDDVRFYTFAQLG